MVVILKGAELDDTLGVFTILTYWILFELGKLEPEFKPFEMVSILVLLWGDLSELLMNKLLARIGDVAKLEPALTWISFLLPIDELSVDWEAGFKSLISLIGVVFWLVRLYGMTWTLFWGLGFRGSLRVTVVRLDVVDWGLGTMNSESCFFDRAGSWSGVSNFSNLGWISFRLVSDMAGLKATLALISTGLGQKFWTLFLNILKEEQFAICFSFWIWIFLILKISYINLIARHKTYTRCLSLNANFF